MRVSYVLGKVVPGTLSAELPLQHSSGEDRSCPVTAGLCPRAQTGGGGDGDRDELWAGRGEGDSRWGRCSCKPWEPFPASAVSLGGQGVSGSATKGLWGAPPWRRSASPATASLSPRRDVSMGHRWSPNGQEAEMSKRFQAAEGAGEGLRCLAPTCWCPRSRGSARFLVGRPWTQASHFWLLFVSCSAISLFKKCNMKSLLVLFLEHFVKKRC